LDADTRRQIETAARKGNATIFGSGMNPGFADLLAAVSTGICQRFRHVLVTESVDVSLFAGDGNMDELGWGSPRDDPGHADRVRQATLVFGDALDLLALLELRDVEARLDNSHFVRVHRSTIINVEQITELHPLFHGDYEIVLKRGTRVTLSRRFRSRILPFLVGPWPT